MNLSKLPLFSMISQRLGWLTERQRVLAENIANIDTPGYKARDLKAARFDEQLKSAGGRLAPASTDPRHLALRSGTNKPEAVKTKGGETTLSGNSVSLESELMKVADTATDYQLITNLYRKQIGMLKTVIGRNQG